MFQFPGFAPAHYEFMCRSVRRLGLPHSEIAGSKPIRGSPTLIAAYHVLHRLSVPRHPPNALKSLDHSHYRCPSGVVPRSARTRNGMCTNEKTIIKNMCRLVCYGAVKLHNPRLAGKYRQNILHSRCQKAFSTRTNPRRNLKWPAQALREGVVETDGIEPTT